MQNEHDYHSTHQSLSLASNAPIPLKEALKYKYSFKDFKMQLGKQENKN